MNKPKKYIRSALSIVLSVILVFAFSGFSIHKHSCLHTHTHNYSLFVAANHCNTNEIESSTSCCSISIEETCCKLDQANEDEDCCENSVEYKKLDTDTFVSSKTIEKSNNEIALFATIYSLFNVDKANTQISIVNKFPDPPERNNNYLTQIQVFLL